jgi:hypothetical protein
MKVSVAKPREQAGRVLFLKNIYVFIFAEGIFLERMND